MRECHRNYETSEFRIQISPVLEIIKNVYSVKYELGYSHPWNRIRFYQNKNQLEFFSCKYSTKFSHTHIFFLFQIYFYSFYNSQKNNITSSK